MIWTTIGLLWVAGSGCGLGAAATTCPAGPSMYVQPIDHGRLAARLSSLPPARRELVENYLVAARREVLDIADGSFPLHDPRERFRNLAERAKGAAVLSSLASFWPMELRERCQREAAAFVREFALAHRARPNLDNEWQAAFWTAEAAIAGWFLWDKLDAELRDAVAEMVIFQADRFIGVIPKMGHRGDSQAETVSWNSTILTLAVNMMPRHPHNGAWDQAAKRLVYNTLAAPQDAADERLGDDGKTVREWIIGANLYPDLALENHNQFHIDYVLSAYRFHIQGAALYWLSGRPLPKAFRHHAREMYEKILLRCMTADGFFVYVSDNDWKRYHCWAESALIHAYLSILEQHPLAAALERRALRNALHLWRSFPAGFAYDNPYVCGKAWTSRVADAVLMHIAGPERPAEAPSGEVESALRGTSRLDTPELLTLYTDAGGYFSSCTGRGGAWVGFAAPRDDVWMMLPVAGNYQARLGGKPVIQQAATRWQRGPDWFWVTRRKEGTKSAEAFVALPDNFAVYIHHLAAADLAGGGAVENAMAVEKPHLAVTAHYSGGSATWRPGQNEWKRNDGREGSAVPGTWLNLQDRFGLAICSTGANTTSEIMLPKAGQRDAIRIRTTAPARTEQTLWLTMWPGRNHGDTEATAAQISGNLHGSMLILRVGAIQIIFNPGDKPSSLPLSGAPSKALEVEAGGVTAWRAGTKLF